MKKLIALIFSTLLVVIGTVLVFSYNTINVFHEKSKETNPEEIVVETSPLCKDENQYISNLISKGYEADWLEDIYDFYLTCGEDITIVESIYTVSEQYDITGRNWIETSYNIATDGIHGELSLNDVIMYVSKGVSVEDIEDANIMCRSGEYTIYEILDMVTEGVAIDKLSSEMYGNSGTTVENMAKMKKLGLSNEVELEKFTLKINDTTANNSAVLVQEIISGYPEYSTDKLNNAKKLSEERNIALEVIIDEYEQTGKYSKYIDR